MTRNGLYTVNEVQEMLNRFYAMSRFKSLARKKAENFKMEETFSESLKKFIDSEEISEDVKKRIARDMVFYLEDGITVRELQEQYHDFTEWKNKRF